MARFETIPRSVPRALLDWPRGKETTNVLFVGNSYTGKSALINGMVREDVAEEAADMQGKGTIRVQPYPHSVGGVTVKLWDTPGLQDGTNVDVEYIRDMKEDGGDKAELMLYCIKMSNTRFQQEDHETIVNLTEGLGKGIWENAIFVLTFANDVIARLERRHKHRPGRKPVHEIFKDLLRTWKEVLSDEVEKAGVDSKVAECIPVVPAGYEIKKLFPSEDTNWMESIWHEMKMRRESSLLSQTGDYTVREQIELLNRQFDEMKSLALTTIKKSGIPQSTVHSWLQSPPLSLKTLLRLQKGQLNSTANVNELFVVLTRFWNLFHPALLEHLVNEIGNGDLNVRMDKYMDQLHQFRVRTCLGDFLGKWVGEIPPGYKEFILKFEEEWSEKTVEDLEQVRIRLSQVLGGNMLFMKMVKSSGTSCSVVLSLPGQLNPRQRGLYDFLRGEAVLRVMVGDHCVLDLQKQNEPGDALIAASCRGDVDKCHKLLGSGTAINYRNKDGDTALSCASREGHTLVVRLLLRRGAQVSPRNTTGMTPLMIASQSGHSQVTYLLLRHMGDPKKEGGTALFCASEEGHASVIRLLLKWRVQVDCRNLAGWTPLMIASKNGHTEAVELLINNGAEVDATNKDESTALFCACEGGHISVIRRLLSHKAQINSRNATGLTPLSVARQNGHPEVVKMLAARGAHD